MRITVLANRDLASNFALNLLLGILGRRTIPVDPAKSLLWHVLALYPVGCEMIRDVISDVAE